VICPKNLPDERHAAGGRGLSYLKWFSVGTTGMPPWHAYDATVGDQARHPIAGFGEVPADRPVTVAELHVGHAHLFYSYTHLGAVANDGTVPVRQMGHRK
jgi:hypothetical protein